MRCTVHNSTAGKSGNPSGKEQVTAKTTSPVNRDRKASNA